MIAYNKPRVSNQLFSPLIKLPFTGAPGDMRLEMDLGRLFTAKSLLNLGFASRTDFGILDNQIMAESLSGYEIDERET